MTLLERLAAGPMIAIGGRKVRLAYVSLATPFDRASWSGIPWYSYHALRSRFPDIHVIETPRLDALVDRAGKLERYGLLVRRRNAVVRLYANRINAALERIQPDAIVGISAAHKLALIDPKWPVVYATDATFASVTSYYDKYHSLTATQLRQGERIQRALVDRVDHFALASQWAVDGARTSYGIPDDRLSVLPFGANLDIDPGMQPPDLDRPLTLLFVGFDWNRKGGDLALETWRILRERTGNAELHIAGCEPESALGLEGVHVHGRINKSDPAGYRLFCDLFARSHFFMMPSRQEAYGIVYCEIAAFGRPAVAAATGGVPTIVRDGETGLLMPPDADAVSYADRIMALWSDPQAYRAMCTAARNRYENTLNWQSWCDGMADRIEAVVAQTAARRNAPAAHPTLIPASHSAAG